jgi:hypothetical protein
MPRILEELVVEESVCRPAPESSFLPCFSCGSSMRSLYWRTAFLFQFLGQEQALVAHFCVFRPQTASFRKQAACMSPSVARLLVVERWAALTHHWDAIRS